MHCSQRMLFSSSNPVGFRIRIKPEQVDIAVGTVLRQIRCEGDYDQREFARLIHSNQASVSKIESGARALKLNELALIADRVGIPVSVLISRILGELQC